MDDLLDSIPNGAGGEPDDGKEEGDPVADLLGSLTGDAVGTPDPSAGLGASGRERATTKWPELCH